MCTLLQVPRSTYYYVATKRDNREELEVVVSDLTYVRVGQNGTIFAYWSIYLTVRLSVIVMALTRPKNFSLAPSVQ
jgi:hypothetical protein